MSEFVELPALYLDDLSGDDASATPALTNRNPAVDEIGVPADQTVRLDIVDIGTAGVDTSATQVYVDFVLAFNAGSFVNGHTGTTQALTSPGAGSADGLRIEITPPANFDSLDVIDVRVVSDLVGGGSAIDITYSFTVEDLTPPELLTATAIEQETIRITFDEPVRALGDGAGNDALTPGNYTFEALNDSVTPAVPLTAVEVLPLSATDFEITVQWEMTAGVTYRLTADGVADVFGNSLSGAVAEFAGFIPQAPARRSFNLYRFMPRKNRDDDFTLDLLRFLNAAQEITDLLLVDIDRWADIYDVDRAAEQYLDAMLADLGNPFSFDLDITKKRKLIRLLVEIYKLKGTSPGVINALRFFIGVEATIKEFSETEAWRLGVDLLGVGTILGSDDPFVLYSFDVEVDRALTDVERRQLREIVDYMKPAHTHHIRTVEP